MKLPRAIPALPSSDMERSVAFHRDKLGFTVPYRQDGFAKLRRDAVEIHHWGATDETWRMRGGSSPIVSGAESFIAGTASCRVGVEGVDELHRAVQPMGILHPNAQLQDTDLGTREFGVLDPEGNLITFFERV